jgi:peptidoglycan hydrolase-like protein with peptidoglycan-binding domain
MKFNPTLPLALALSVGAAGAVMAQTAPSQTPTTYPSSGYSQPSTPSGQPQANAAQTPSATGQAPAATAQRQSAPTTGTPSMASGMAPGGNETVRYAQYQLHAAGLYNGPQDGIMDPNTRSAIARYQEQHGLGRSESLDESTLASMEGSQTTGSGSATPPAATSPESTPSAANNPSAGAMGGNAGKTGAR